MHTELTTQHCREVNKICNLINVYSQGRTDLGQGFTTMDWIQRPPLTSKSSEATNMATHS